MNWVLAALGMLACGAAGSLLFSRFNRLSLSLALISIFASGISCFVAAVLALQETVVAPIHFEWPLPLGTAMLSLDGLSGWFLIVISTVSIAVAIYSWGYYVGGTGHGVKRAYAPLLCVMIASMVLLVMAADVVMFLLGWELMSLSAFFLVGLQDDEPSTRSGAWMYLIATHLGTAIGVLPLFGAYVARTGTTEMSAFSGAVWAGETQWPIALFLLGIIGFGTKAGFMPFHVWLPAAHPVAPSPVSALMSGVVIKAGVYGLLRSLSWLPELPVACGIGLGILSIATALYGIICALGQPQIKRMLAYSSVENIGIIGLSIAVGILGKSLHEPTLVALGLSGALLHVLNHSLFKGLLFLSAGTVLHSTGTGDVERLGGLLRVNRANAFAFLIGAVAICALPPLNGFVSEFVIYSSLFAGARGLTMAYAVFFASCIALLALVGAIALATFAKAFSIVFLGEQRDPAVVPRRTPASMNVAALFLAGACLSVVVLAGTVGLPVIAAVRSITRESSEMELSAPIGSVAGWGLPIVVFVLLLLALGGIRWYLPRGRAERAATWGCSYAYPARSMQYTGSSFGWSLLHSFRHFVLPTRTVSWQSSRSTGSVMKELFPGRNQVSSETRDLVLQRVYQPVFVRLEHWFERLWPLQHGRIQLYLVYIVITVLIVFLVEAWQAPSAPRSSTDGAHSSSHAGRGLGDL